MAHDDHFLPLYTGKGAPYAVLLSAELWARGRYRLEPVIRSLLEELDPVEKPEPLDEWRTFLELWDFKYPVSADVECPNCHIRTDDWEHDPQKPFRLKGALLSGMVVFTCASCGATVRKKHFKDHVCFDYTLPS